MWLCEVSTNDLVSPFSGVGLVAMVGTGQEFIDREVGVEFGVPLESDAPIIYS